MWALFSIAYLASCQRRRKFAAVCRSKSAALMEAKRPPIGGLSACRVSVLS